MAFDFWNTFGPGALFGDTTAGANKYLSQIGDRASQYFDPYINAGKWALPQLQGQYGSLMNDPGSMVNKFGGSFKESPGFDFAMRKALEGSNRAMAAGGVSGTPQHEAQNMELATQLANQDYYNWLDRTLGLYGEGLHGTQGMASGGLQAGSSMADMIAQMLSSQAELNYSGGANQRSGLGGLIGGGIGLALGGPMGGMVGSSIGSQFGGGNRGGSGTTGRFL